IGLEVELRQNRDLVQPPGPRRLHALSSELERGPRRAQETERPIPADCSRVVQNHFVARSARGLAQLSQAMVGRGAQQSQERYPQESRRPIHLSEQARDVIARIPAEELVRALAG